MWQNLNKNIFFLEQIYNVSQKVFCLKVYVSVFWGISFYSFSFISTKRLSYEKTDIYVTVTLQVAHARLGVLLGDGTAWKDISYLPRFGVSFTLQAV